MTPQLRVRRLDTVQPEPVRFLPGGWLPESMLSLIVGDPGLGKTRQLLSLAAATTRGWAWPEGDETAAPANVLWCGHEDTLEHVIRPVFDAIGGDASRFFAIDALVTETRDGAERESMFSLTVDGLLALEAALQEHQPKVLAIDPISGHLGAIDSFKDAEVRSVLVPLAQLAHNHTCAVVGNLHLNKDQQRAAAYRIGGSIAFYAVARAVFFTAADPHDPTGSRVLLFNDKNSVHAKQAPRGYRVVDRDGVGVVAWDREPVTCTLADALTANGAGEGGQEATEAESFLRELLANGPLVYKAVDDARRDAGISERTLKRAKEKLGVRSERHGFGPGGTWRWTLPGRPAPTPPPAPTAHRGPSASLVPNTSFYGTQWHGMTNGTTTHEDIGGHRESKNDVFGTKGTGGPLCSVCGEPAPLKWSGEPRCYRHHPMGTAVRPASGVN